MARTPQLVAPLGLSFMVACTAPNPGFDPRGGGTLDMESESSLGDSDAEDSAEGPTDTNGESTTEEPTDTNGDGDGEGSSESTGDTDTGPGCVGDEKLCDDMCVDTDWSPQHCSDCDAPCGDAQICALGQCTSKKYVFITSGKYGADLIGGIEGGDDLCQLLANEAQLPGTYRAWLANEEESPEDSFNKLGAYVRTDNTLIASSWMDLIDGQLSAPILYDQNGMLVQGSPVCNFELGVWTGTFEDGSSTDKDCGGWSSLEGGGTAGNASSTTFWSSGDSCSPECEIALSLYCFQQ